MSVRILIICLLIVQSLIAQKKEDRDSLATSDASGIQYFFSGRTGMLTGCTNCSFQSNLTFSGSTIHGLRLGKVFSVGAGIGLNSYPYMQVIPVFANLGINLFGKKNKVFVEFNYGSGKPWIGKIARQEYGLKEARGGRLVETTLGYSISYYKMRVYFLLGYHFQRTSKYFEYPNSRWLNGREIALEPNRKYVTADFSRLFMGLGVGWK